VRFKRSLRRLERAADDLRRRVDALGATAGQHDYARYRSHPIAYARHELKVRWWAKQKAIARALTRPPYRVLVKAGHSVGKTMMAGGLVNWKHDTRNPGVVLTTAPTARQVRDLLWKEVRKQRRGRGGFPGPKEPRLESAPDHFAHGLTANDCDAFQGHHEESVFIVFDEAQGVDPEFWDAAESMVMGADYAWLVILNPTDSSCRAYQEEISGRWTVIDIPCTEHPNILAELNGEPPPYPSAVRLAWLSEHIEEWCEPIRDGDQCATDLQWPPDTGSWWRPGPLAEARILARWPTAGAGVWSDPLFSAAERRELPLPAPDTLPEIGVDCARFGDDRTEIHVRCGPVSLHHESANGWDTAQTAGRLKQLCREWAAWATARLPANSAPIPPERVLVKVDDDGLGGGVFDQHGEYQFIPIRAGSTADAPNDYPNVRSELWFVVADRARRGELSLAALPAKVRMELRLQALAPTWKLDSAGRRVVEKKEDTKKKIGRSPDGLDAMNLSFYRPASLGVGQFVPQQPTPEPTARDSSAARRGLYGR
jgi:hypothetical protein